MKTAISQVTNRENLLFVAELLNRSGINWCVFFGTLLGLVRDGDVIKGDDDIDIYVPLEERSALIEALHREGFEWRQDPPNHSEYFMQIKREVDGEVGLIDFYFPDGAVLPGFLVDRWNFSASTASPKKFMHVPEGLVLPFQTCRLFDSNIRFPAQPIEAVEWLYGETWRTPISKESKYRMTMVHNTPVMQMRLPRAVERFIPRVFRPYLERLVTKLTTVGDVRR